MKTLNISIIIIALFLFNGLLFAQEKWSVELRPGINFPTEKVGEFDLKTGFGGEVSIGYKFMEHLGGYLGWGWNKFKADNSTINGNTDIEETGYTFGLQFIHPLGKSSKLSYLVRAGGIYNHIELENNAGNITEDSDHRLGWEIGAGMDIDLGINWYLRPQVGYRALSGDIEIDTLKFDFDLNYVVIAVGIVKTF